MPFATYLARVQALVANHDAPLELRSPAKAKDLSKLAALPGVLVPDELAEAWRITDGCDHNLFARPQFFTGYAFLGVREAIEARAGFARRAPRYAGYDQPRTRDRRIAPGWYQPGWLPFAAFGGATLVLLVDGSPAAGGRPGQIIAFTHDPDEITYIAGSFSELLAASLPWIEANAEDLLDLA